MKNEVSPTTEPEPAQDLSHRNRLWKSTCPECWRKPSWTRRARRNSYTREALAHWVSWPEEQVRLQPLYKGRRYTIRRRMEVRGVQYAFVWSNARAHARVSTAVMVFSHATTSMGPASFLQRLIPLARMGVINELENSRPDRASAIVSDCDLPD